MRKYEVMYIVNASLEDAARQATIEKMHAILTNNGATIVNVDEKGLQEFAYPIENMKKGYYVVTTFDAENDALKEFERLMRIESGIVRFLITRLDA